MKSELLLLFWEGTKQRLNFVGFHVEYSHLCIYSPLTKSTLQFPLKHDVFVFQFTVHFIFLLLFFHQLYILLSYFCW